MQLLLSLALMQIRNTFRQAVFRCYKSTFTAAQSAWLNLILVFALLPPHTPVRYYAWSGDTVETVALRFGVQPDEIASPQPLPVRGLLTPGQLLILPPRLYEMQPAPRLLPDSEIVY